MGHTGCIRLLLFLWVGLALLPGCQPDNHGDSYLRMLEKVLPAGITQPETRFPEPPDAATRVFDSRRGKLANVDILDLRGCDLKKTLIRERSRLGLHAKPSQQLLLLLEFLRVAPACIDQLRQQGNDSLADTLNSSLNERRHRLPQLVFDATLGSTEYKALWSGTPAPRAFPRVAQPAAVSALAGINGFVRRWSAGDYRADNREFELLLGEVAGGSAGSLSHTLSRQEALLAEASRLLQGPHCDTRNKRNSIRWLAAARQYFLSELRPRFTASLERLIAFHTALATLERQLSVVLPAKYEHWRVSRNQHILALRTAPSVHLAQLMRAMKSCART